MGLSTGKSSRDSAKSTTTSLITSIFTDLDIRAVRAGREPLEAVLAQRLVAAAGQLDGEAVGDPLMVASLQDRLGQSLLNLGYAPEAIPLFAKALEIRTAGLGECRRDEPPAHGGQGKHKQRYSHLARHPGYVLAAQFNLAEARRATASRARRNCPNLTGLATLPMPLA